jgi:hypothetical protein
VENMKALRRMLAGLVCAALLFVRNEAAIYAGCPRNRRAHGKSRADCHAVARV